MFSLHLTLMLSVPYRFHFPRCAPDALRHDGLGARSHVHRLVLHDNPLLPSGSEFQ
jgi:hypothetical protein